MQSDTILCPLANEQGIWYGSKTWFIDNYKTIHPYKLNFKFPKKGEYNFYLNHGMRDTVVLGINAVGIELLNSNNKE